MFEHSEKSCDPGCKDKRIITGAGYCLNCVHLQIQIAADKKEYLICSKGHVCPRV